MSETSRDPIIGDWRGDTIYGCPLCPFDTASLDNFNDHMRAVHYLPEGADPIEDAADSEPAPAAADTPEVPVVEPQGPEPPAEEPPAPEVVEPEPDPKAEPVPDSSAVEPEPAAPETTPEPEPPAAGNEQ